MRFGASWAQLYGAFLIDHKPGIPNTLELAVFSTIIFTSGNIILMFSVEPGR